MLPSSFRTAVRRFATEAAAHSHATHEATGAVAHVAHEAAEEATAASAKGLWKNISFFVAVPGMLLVAANTVYAVTSHGGAGHDEHGHGHGHEEEQLPVKYGTYLAIRNKPFPWGHGDKTLFWNDHVNKLGAESHDESAASESKDIHPVTAWIEKHMESEESMIEATKQRLQESKAGAEQRLAFKNAQIQVMPEIKDPKSIERAFGHQVLVGRQ